MEFADIDNACKFVDLLEDIIRCLKIELEIPIADEVLDEGAKAECGTRQCRGCSMSGGLALWKRRKASGYRARSSWS